MRRKYLILVFVCLAFSAIYVLISLYDAFDGALNVYILKIFLKPAFSLFYGAISYKSVRKFIKPFLIMFAFFVFFDIMIYVIYYGINGVSQGDRAVSLMIINCAFDIFIDLLICGLLFDIGASVVKKIVDKKEQTQNN